jgi:hypothetical protein
LRQSANAGPAPVFALTPSAVAVSSPVSSARIGSAAFKNFHCRLSAIASPVIYPPTTRHILIAGALTEKPLDVIEIIRCVGPEALGQRIIVRGSITNAAFGCREPRL